MVAYTDYPHDMRVRREAEALAGNGYEVFVIASKSGSGPARREVGPVHLIQVPLQIKRGSKGRYFFQYAMFFALSSRILVHLHMRKRLSVVHVHSLPDFQVFCATLPRLGGVRTILDLHEAMPEILAARFDIGEHSLWFRGASVLEQASCRFANHVIVANDGIGSAIRARGIPGTHITAVYNIGDSPMEYVSPEALSARLKLPHGRLIVHAGGVNRERDLETVIAALAKLPSQLNVHLIVAGAGDPDYLDRLRALAQEAGVGERVKFVGELTLAQARALMSLSEVGLVSSERNSLTELAWPTRLIEFAHLGKPLVVPNLRFVMETMGDSAFYYQAGDPDSLACRLREVLERPANCSARVQAAMGICGRFSWKNMLDALLRIYRNLEST